MPKAVKVLCDRCESKIVAGSSFCASCGYPTRWATHEERTTWEVSQWKTADRSHPPKPAKHENGSRRWNPFARKPDAKPTLTVVKSELPAAPIEPVAAAVAEPAPVVVAPEPPRISIPAKPAATFERKPAPKPVVRMKPAPTVAPGPRDAEPLADTPATVMALRLLNARVAELDAKVQRLERELEGTRPISNTP
jgi:hypothetical protein